jgi:O-antigen ligase
VKRSVAPSRVALPGVFDRWAPWILVILTAAVPLAFDFSLYDTFDLPKMLLVYAVVLALAGLWFWQQSSEGWKFRPTGMTAPILTFLGVVFLSCVTSIDPSRSLTGAYRSYVYGWLPMTAFAFLFFLTSQIDSEKVMRQVALAALVSGALAGLYGLLQYSGNEIFEWMPRVAGGRVWSSLGNPIYFGAICMMALPLVLNLQNLGGALAALVLLLGLVISLSRSAWLGSVVAMVCLLFVFRHKVLAKRSTIVVGLVAVGLLGLVFPQARGRLKVLMAVHESSNVGRIEGWKAGMKVWRHYPFLGAGPDTFFEAFRPYRSRAFIESIGAGVTQAHAHNELIQFASTLGSAGLIAWLWICCAFARRLKVIFQMDPASFAGLRGSLMASLAAIFIQNQFNPSSVASAAWTAIFAGLVISSPRVGEDRGGGTTLKTVTPIPASKQPLLSLEAWPSVQGRIGPMVPHRGGRDLWRPWPIWSRIAGLGAFFATGLWAITIPLRADQYYKEGIVLDANHKPLEALTSYREAVHLRPDMEAYQTSLSNAARSLAQLSPEGVQRKHLWEEAWKSAQAPVQWHPANPDAWNNLGVAAMWLTQQAGDDKMPVAKSSFEKAIALDPVFVDAWANLAKWYHIAGDLDGEKRMWKIVLQLDPQHAMALQVLGYDSGGHR